MEIFCWSHYGYFSTAWDPTVVWSHSWTYLISTRMPIVRNFRYKSCAQGLCRLSVMGESICSFTSQNKKSLARFKINLILKLSNKKSKRYYQTLRISAINSPFSSLSLSINTISVFYNTNIGCFGLVRPLKWLIKFIVIPQWDLLPKNGTLRVDNSKLQ